MQPWDEGPGEASVHTEIAKAMIRLTGEYTGRKPARARTAIANDIVTVLLEDTMTRGERELLDTGKGEVVLEKRRAHQQMMRDDMTAAVQMLSERNVIAFMSDHHLPRDMAAEVFVLEPLASTDGGGPDTADRA